MRISMNGLFLRSEMKDNQNPKDDEQNQQRPLRVSDIV